MRLRDVANKFNDMVCLDGYTGTELFNAQLGLYDDNKRDSETAERRVLSISPDVTIPTRRCVQAAGTRFILGHANPDDYLGETIRVGYVAHEATFLSQLRTLEEVCLGDAGFEAYAGRSWVKDIAYSQQDSVETPIFHIHFASTEVVQPNMLVTFEGRLNLIRSLNYGAGGTIVAACEQMVEPSIETASILVPIYDSVQDTTVTVPTPATAVRMRWQSLFRYLNSVAPKFEPGDVQLAFAQTGPVVAPGTDVELSDGRWRVQSVVPEGSVLLCRATRYG